MKSLTTPDFWNLYAKLPLKIKKQARKTYQLWQENQSHPSLHFKKVGKNFWSIRITRNYRALPLKKGDDYYWVWIGTHEKYELLLS
jgi:hypothetical protein